MLCLTQNRAGWQAKGQRVDFHEVRNGNEVIFRGQKWSSTSHVLTCTRSSEGSIIFTTLVLPPRTSSSCSTPGAMWREAGKRMWALHGLRHFPPLTKGYSESSTLWQSQHPAVWVWNTRGSDNKLVCHSEPPSWLCLSPLLALLDAVFQRRQAPLSSKIPSPEQLCLSLTRVMGNGTLVVIHTKHRYNLEVTKDLYQWLPPCAGTHCMKEDLGTTVPSFLPHRARSWSRITSSAPASSPGFHQGWEISAHGYTLQAAS